MPEVCDNHSQLVQKVGEISGKQDAMITMQQEIKDNIGKLFALVNANTTNAEVQKTKFAPALWVLTVLGSLVIGGLLRGGLFG